jgi:hypothetical protein
VISGHVADICQTPVGSRSLVVSSFGGHEKYVPYFRAMDSQFSLMDLKILMSRYQHLVSLASPTILLIDRNGTVMRLASPLCRR